MTALADQRVYTIVESIRHDDIKTSKGTLKVGKEGYMRTRNRELANEIKQLNPTAIVTEHEIEAGGQALRGQSIRSFPKIPWKDDEYWFEKRTKAEEQ